MGHGSVASSPRASSSSGSSNEKNFSPSDFRFNNERGFCRMELAVALEAVGCEEGEEELDNVVELWSARPVIRWLRRRFGLRL